MPHERYRTHYAEVSPPIALGPDPTQRVAEWWRAYCACITEVDSGIGRVIEALEERDLLDDTVILYASDHGEYAGDHGRWGKGDFHEPGVHVPFIASGPGIAAGHTSDALAELIDVGRTVVDLMGVETSPPGSRSESKAGIVRGEAEPSGGLLCRDGSA